MGASKTAQYSSNEIQKALVGRALAHPARIRIINVINQNHSVQPLELCTILELNNSSVHNHLTKLIAADVIFLEFKNNGHHLFLNRPVLEEFTLAIPIQN